MIKNILLNFTIIVLLSACNSKSVSIDAEPKEDKDISSITLTDEQVLTLKLESSYPLMTSLSDEIEVNGIINNLPQSLYDINIPYSAYITKILVHEGEPVKQGEVLFTMNAFEFVSLQQNYISSNAKLEYLRKDLARQKALSSDASSPIKQYEQINSEYLVEQSNNRLLANQLSKLGISPGNKLQTVIEIKSPATGYVRNINVSTGSKLEAGQSGMQVFDLSTVEATFYIPDKYYNRLKVGQEISITVGDKITKSDIHTIGKSLDENLKTVNAVSIVKNDHLSLIPGMNISAKIKLGTISGLSISNTSIINSGEANYVIVETEKLSYKMVEIEIIAKSNNLVIVTNLAKTDKVVTTGAYNVYSAMTLEQDEG